MRLCDSVSPLRCLAAQRATCAAANSSRSRMSGLSCPFMNSRHLLLTSWSRDLAPLVLCERMRAGKSKRSPKAASLRWVLCLLMASRTTYMRLRFQASTARGGTRGAVIIPVIIKLESNVLGISNLSIHNLGRNVFVSGRYYQRFRVYLY